MPVDVAELIKRAVHLRPPRGDRKRRAPPSTGPAAAAAEDEADVPTGSQKRRRAVEGPVSLEPEEDPVLAIAEHCAQFPQEYASAWHYLSAELFKSSSESRLKTLNVIDALFHSSHAFRGLVNSSIESVARCGGLLRTLSGAALQAEAPADNAAAVASRVLELIALWDHVYGLRLPQLHSLARYLRESERMQMPDVRATVRRLRREREEKQHTRRQRAFLRAAQVLDQELDSLLRRAHNGMDAMDQCFVILFPTVGEDADGGEEGFEDIAWEADPAAAAAAALDSDDPLAGAAPYTLEITLSAEGDADAQTGELVRAALLEAAQELAGLLPRLRRCEELLGAAASLRTSAESSLAEAQRECVALSRVEAAIARARELLSQRCRALFAS